MARVLIFPRPISLERGLSVQNATVRFLRSNLGEDRFQFG
jgi:hypothetical protein